MGDFDDLVRKYRRELHVYCYRMLGSFDEAEDHVQEVLLRAWRSREGFQGQSSPRTWLYRVATNACLDTLRHDARRAVPAPSSGSVSQGPSVAAMPWVQPYPDSLLDEIAADQPGPEAVTVTRETISLAFLAAIQLLPTRQRAVLILRDVVSWPAAEVAELLNTSIPAVNSALQRARATLRNRWPAGRLDWAPAAAPDPGQRNLLQRFIAAHEQADPEALIAMLRHDIRLAISPQVGEWSGQQQVGDALRDGMTSLGQWRMLPIMANRQPAAAGYLRRPGETAFSPFVLAVLRHEDGQLTEIAAFEQSSMFTAFGLPARLLQQRTSRMGQLRQDKAQQGDALDQIHLRPGHSDRTRFSETGQGHHGPMSASSNLRRGNGCDLRCLRLVETPCVHGVSTIMRQVAELALRRRG